MFENFVMQEYIHELLSDADERQLKWRSVDRLIVTHLKTDTYWVMCQNTSKHLLSLPSNHNQSFDWKEQEHHPHQGSLPGNWLVARIADLTPDLQMLLS